jgi:hypothetical protein
MTTRTTVAQPFRAARAPRMTVAQPFRAARAGRLETVGAPFQGARARGQAESLPLREESPWRS